MSSYDFFWGLGDIFQWVLSPLDSIGNIFNYTLIVVGFIGMFIWLNKQHKFNKAAEATPGKLK
ncbi:MAG: hypothetical protein ACI837_000064 [Crocinitomicaceae bacterium]|jgi:hypothetical protein